MPADIRKASPTPPSTRPHPMRYSALVTTDGTLLPIEVHLGRRLLRTIEPGSREARALLREGQVTLTTSDGSILRGVRIQEVYARLGAAIEQRLASTTTSRAERAFCRASLETLARHRRSLRRDH
jgi:hypothetical protein